MPDQSQKLFEILVRQNEPSLMTYLRTMVRDPGLVDDLFQETLITAWKKFDQYDQSLPLAPWLRGIALNLARNAGRRQQRECLVFSDSMNSAIETAIQTIEQADGQDWGDKPSALSDCLAELPPRSRELIRRRYEENLNASAIAELTQQTASGVRKKLQRVRDALARCVGGKLAEATVS